MNVSGRLQRVRNELASKNCDSMIVTSLVNSRWLTGFTGSNATTVITPSKAVLITDGRYKIQGVSDLEKANSEAELCIAPTGVDAKIAEMLGGLDAVGFEAANITWARHGKILETLGGADLTPLVGLIEGLRQIKDGNEVACLEKAARIADEAFARTYPLLATPNGITESHFARALEDAMNQLGSDGPSFETIVAAGPRSALPHARPSAKVISDGDLVVVDFGAKIDGYGSDMTRTVLAGAGHPTAAQANLYAAVADAQKAGRSAVKAGATELSVDFACRSVLEDAGLGEHFVHGTGHGLGLEIHEAPIMSSRSTGSLMAGFVVTVEPGAYLADLGGVRIEDSVVVTEEGCRPITLSPYGLNPEF